MSTINLPQETLVKVTFRCSEQDKADMIGSDCILHISVGQEYHEGEKLLATMDLINEKFKSCTIMLCDTLQRHTLKLSYPDLSDAELLTKAQLQGNEWIKRNHKAIEYLTIESKLMRWNEWLNHPEYYKYKNIVSGYYASDDKYRNAVHETINKFLKRRNIVNDEQAFKLCEAYILEECPILVPLWAKTGCKFIIYPRFRTPAMRETYNRFIVKPRMDVLREVALKFNKRIKPKKLSFSYVASENIAYNN